MDLSTSSRTRFLVVGNEFSQAKIQGSTYPSPGMTPNIRNTCGEPVTVPDEIINFQATCPAHSSGASSKSASPASQLLFGAFAAVVMSSDSAIMNRGTLSVARHKRNVVAYPNQRTAVLAPILFLDLKLSSLSLHQLGDERPVGSR